MKLSVYLKQENITHKQFTENCAKGGFVFSTHALAKWCNGQRIPRKDEMHTIFKATDGNVTANDFYDLPIAN